MSDRTAEPMRSFALHRQPVRRTGWRESVSRLKRFAGAAVLFAVSIGFIKAAGSAQSEQLIYLEPNYQRSFGPQKVTPRGTIFSVKVLKKAEHDALHLYRCDTPCKTANSVKTWPADGYRAGDLLSWAADEDGSYYFWAEDTRNATSVTATTYEFKGKRIRIAFTSGAIVEAWYVLP